jgi:L-aminopeptidase/D-esterase-like protein
MRRRGTAVSRRTVLAALSATAGTALAARTPAGFGVVTAHDATPTTSPLPSATPRARDLGVPFVGMPGPLNAITDVPGVRVEHVTLIAGEGPLVVGQGPVRTGLTAVLPRGDLRPVFAGWDALNGIGEMTGTEVIAESGYLVGPVVTTNTLSVGLVRDAVTAWAFDRLGPDTSYYFTTPVVAETYDGVLNDINGRHVRLDHVFAALDALLAAGDAAPAPVAEGNVGGGTGMIAHEFKGGIGTSSRRVAMEAGAFTIGALVQANHGTRANLTIAGVPVGREIPDLLPEVGPQVRATSARTSSIIGIVATDAPLLPHQLERLARRAALGVGIVGGRGEDGSGDIFLAFSTAFGADLAGPGVVSIEMLQFFLTDPLLEATVHATEEAIVNALVAAETMTGGDGATVYALPHDRLRDVLRTYHRLAG